MGFLRRRGAALGIISAIGVVLIGIALTVGLSSSAERPASATINDGLPTQTPRRELPTILDGSVRDSARVGNVIVVGGDFTQVEKTNGQIISVDGVYAYDINSGAMIEAFNPVLTRNGGPAEVLAVEPAGPDTVLLGGKFGSADGFTGHTRLTRIDVSTGRVDTSFAGSVNGPVKDIVLKNNRLFVGGEFTSVNGVARINLVEMNGVTGAVDPTFRFDVTNSSRDAGIPFGPKYLGITPDNILVVAHRGNTVQGQPRPGVALINLATDALMGWRTGFWEGQDIHTVDAEVSPDGTYVVLAGDGGDFPFWGRDSAVAFSLERPNALNQQPKWIARNFDSTFSVGISEHAVFLGGHFCWVESAQSPEPWPGDNEFTNNNSCFGANPAGRFAPDVVNRDQIAAFDPDTGKALDWDPGASGHEGVLSIEVIGRGLLIGHDGRFVGRDDATGDRRAWPVGRHAFLDDAVPGGKNTLLANGAPVTQIDGLCHGHVPTMTGTNLNDVLIGTDGDDVIMGGEGQDFIEGGGGNDIICGGHQADEIHGGNGNDVIYGNEAADTLFGGFGNDDLRGGYWKDSLNGGPGNDTLRGGRSTDVLLGGAGNDTLIGNDGMDRLNGGAGNDALHGQQGQDQVEGSSGADFVSGGIGWDRCSGALFGRADNPGDTLAGCERR